ncbi:ABC transporter substrate-binding protein [Clostridium sp. A1-XYC3]|uniref:ABC transporter substrate-binding protein n=1 Tax=Clostridium tanneri TaxID=3037988 RepID=A0ABU4JSR1_9CLOT|nr:ABC transporter substrate-binding protein [Clostridium sp. A1-XYC3]MDW8801202.1 ABC transporter substrate-binding protein [Clostridium sp. A1-XYC3]
MIVRRRGLAMLLLILLLINISGCGKGKETAKEKQLNIYIDTKDKGSLDILKFITEEYKKDNGKVKVNVNNPIGGKIEEDISKGGESDIVFTSRNNMMKLSKKGLLSDMDSYYDENKISERYYTVVKAYGRFNDKYYGVPLIPYTIEILYNQKALDKLNIKPPSNITDFGSMLKKLGESGKRIPVIIPEDLDINNGLFSIIVNNKVSMRKLESIYDSGASAYKSLNEMQQAFDTLSDLSKAGGINKNTFEIGNDSTVDKFVKGDMPLIVATSHYAKSFKDENIKVIGENMGDSSINFNIPVVTESIMSVPLNHKNGEEVTNFIKFALSDDTQKKLVEKGFITGNKKVNNSKGGGVKGSVIQHLQESTEDGVAFVYNIPEKLKGSISSKVDEILSGKQSKKEWEEAVDEAYR